MPKFMDYHATMPQLPPEAAQAMAARLKAGQADQFGVKGLNVFIGIGGQGYCLTEAPSAEAVVKSHEALGFPMSQSNVVEVVSMV
jgi:hypothetical protein